MQETAALTCEACTFLGSVQGFDKNMAAKSLISARGDVRMANFGYLAAGQLVS